MHREKGRAGDRGRVPVFVVTGRWPGGLDAAVRGWRRLLVEAGERHFEGELRAGESSFFALKQVVGAWLSLVESIDVPDAELEKAAARVAGPLALERWHRDDAEPALESVHGGATATIGSQLMFFEDVVRLLTALGERISGNVVFRADDYAPPAMISALRYLVDRYTSEPGGGRGGRGAAAGSIVVFSLHTNLLVPALREGLRGRADVHFVDLSGVAVAQARAALAGDELIGMLIDGTGGDIARLPALVRGLVRAAETTESAALSVLDPEASDLVAALAVVDRGADYQEISAVCGREISTDLVADLIAGGLLREESAPQHRIAFARTSTAAVAGAALTAERRLELHRRWARELTRRAADSDGALLAEAAKHAAAAGESQRAADLALRAASLLQAEYDFQSARPILGLALELLEPADPRRREALESLIDIAETLNDGDEALALCEQLLAFSGSDTGAVLRRRAALHLEAGRHGAALEDFHEAGDRAADTASIAEALYGLGRHDEVLELATTARADPQLIEGRDALRMGNTVGKVKLARGEFGEAQRVFQRNLELARANRWSADALRATFNLAAVAYRQGDLGLAESMYLRCLDQSSETAWPVNRARAMLNLAVVYHQTARYQDALSSYRDALRTFEEVRNHLLVAATALNLGSLYATLGHGARAAEVLQRGLRVSRERGLNYYLGRSACALAELEVGRGDLVAAAESVEVAAAAIMSSGGAAQRVQLMRCRAQLAHEQGDIDSRDTLVAEARALASSGEDPELVADCLAAEGRFKLADEEYGIAEPLLKQALALYEERESRERVWQTQCALAHAKAGLGHFAEARSLAAAAESIVESIAANLPGNLRDVYRRSPNRVRLARVREQLSAGRIPTPARGGDPDPAVHTAEYASWRARYPDIVGDSRSLIRVLEVVDRMEHSSPTVLVLGESGTGKELIAEAIHRRSDRREGPLIKVNCAAFVEGLLQSELFGHERGAFTGAHAERKGRFELADGGTIFLDEIGDVSAATQVSLLRVLQEGAFERVGGVETIRVNARLICATNRNLDEMVREGSFRLDLYYRLKGMVVELPPLRERRDDVPALVEHFCAVHTAAGAPIRRCTEAAMERLLRYSWPGNVRELDNFVRSVLLFADGERVELHDVNRLREFFVGGSFSEHELSAGENAAIQRACMQARPTRGTPGPDTPAAAVSAVGRGGHESLLDWAGSRGLGLPELKRELEREMIVEALRECGGNITRAARMLEMKRPRLSQIVNGDSDLRELRRRFSDG